MFLELAEEQEFRQNYFDMLKTRLILGSLELEGEDGKLSSATQAQKIFGQYEAINYAFSQNKDDYLNHYGFLKYICNIASKVSNTDIENFRTTTALVNGSKVQRSFPQMIRNDLIYLIDDYIYQIDEYRKKMNNTNYDNAELYEIEAQFHIRFLYIHPFEDTNGRTARIILTRNLCQFNNAPAVLTKENKKMYCQFIENGDYKRLAKLIKALSEKEMSTMVALYKELDENGKILDNKMTEEQENKYQEAIKRMKKIG